MIILKNNQFLNIRRSVKVFKGYLQGLAAYNNLKSFHYVRERERNTEVKDDGLPREANIPRATTDCDVACRIRQANCKQTSAQIITDN